ncbi:hypothetical protein RFI_02662 [Reticulomyxa filosa]|uniref:Uncharacterized protein n=1 Tax=Reticulomyxa filosa TaxID=46433 RepID=X6P9W9_RETFI|nr:hypothetical protein RFI_02662 [Reticulomyxa filosa]|eukprot:ETO34432.1 hypothetical protein RFI_02662 [Reticulomyxa filosa]
MCKITWSNCSEKHFDDVFKCLINGLKDSDSFVRKSCMEALVTFSWKWNERQLDITVQCLIDGFQKWILLQIDSVFTCLINGLKNDRELYAESIGFLSMKLSKKQLDDVFECLNGLKDEKECIRVLYKDARISCAKSLGEMSTNFTDKQLKEKRHYFYSYQTALGNLLTKWNEKQLDIIFQFVLSCKDGDIHVPVLCTRLLETIFAELEGMLLEEAFDALMNVCKRLIDISNDTKALQKISTN